MLSAQPSFQGRSLTTAPLRRLGRVCAASACAAPPSRCNGRGGRAKLCPAGMLIYPTSMKPSPTVRAPEQQRLPPMHTIPGAVCVNSTSRRHAFSAAIVPGRLADHCATPAAGARVCSLSKHSPTKPLQWQRWEGQAQPSRYAHLSHPETKPHCTRTSAAALAPRAHHS